MQYIGLLGLGPVLRVLSLAGLGLQQAYGGAGDPARMASAGAAAVTAIVLWLYLSWLLARRSGVGGRRALTADLPSYLPFLALAGCAHPAVRGDAVAALWLLCAGTVLSALIKARVLVRFGKPWPAPDAASLRWAIWPILVLGFVLRLSLIRANRFVGDEALFSHWGLLIATGKDVALNSEIVDKPPVFFYTLAVFFRLFGPSEAVARLPNILASAAGIGIVYAAARRLYGLPTAALSALLLALSPFDIQSAPTAFTDPLMVVLTSASCLLALQRRFLAAGLAMGLAAMTKQTAVFVLPLLALAILASRSQRGLGRAALALGAGVGIALLPCIYWDRVIRASWPSFVEVGSAHYGEFGLAAWGSFLPRLRAWLSAAGLLTASPPLNALFLGGVPLLLAVGLWRRGRGHEWRYDWGLAGYVIWYFLAHSAVSFQLWNRYLLALAPAVAILLARVLLLPIRLLSRERQLAPGKTAYAALVPVFLAALLAGPVQVALKHGYPVGGEKDTYLGIDEVASFFRQNVPAGSVVFHHWLGWHYSFYMFDFPYEFQYFPDSQHLIEMARRIPDRAKYLTFPSFAPRQEVELALCTAGLELRELHRVHRPDGTVSFTICRIEARSGDLSPCAALEGQAPAEQGPPPPGRFADRPGGEGAGGGVVAAAPMSLAPG
ncbi:MAG: glycosyltransferase family 39 protein [Anaerolineae bacterium]|nr:glycosyltransferase family 39 protein [Anaerolineae bacterium]